MKKINQVSNAGIRKWDSASLSSGVSSGDLSSPCECGENEMEGDFGDENLIGDEELESHYVSQDVLEKIRECGSTVTYYGGRVVDKKSEHMNTMTKAIMKEIRGQERKTCQVCQPHGCRQAMAEHRRHSSSNHQTAKLDGLGNAAGMVAPISGEPSHKLDNFQLVVYKPSFYYGSITVPY